jgi:hypothetical protein
MAQLNDLLVLGNTSLIGDVIAVGKITSSEFIGSLTGNASTATNVAWSGVTSKPSYYDAKAIKSITRSGTTFTATHMDGTTTTFTQQDNNTDTLVKQSETTTDSFRPLIVGKTSNSDISTLAATVTD